MSQNMSAKDNGEDLEEYDAFETTPGGDVTGSVSLGRGVKEVPRPQRSEGMSRRPTLRRASTRPDHLQILLNEKRAGMRHIERMEQGLDTSPSIGDILSSAKKKQLEENSAFVQKAMGIMDNIKKVTGIENALVEVRLEELSYGVRVDPTKQNEIQTVYNQSQVYALLQTAKRIWKREKKPEKQTAYVLDRINLVLKPGKMYLVLGPPASGKTSLLKAIAGRLRPEKHESLTGTVKYNGIELTDRKDVIVQNVISFVGQLDEHAPRLTVQDTFEFAFQCKSGGTHIDPELLETDEARQLVAKFDKEHALVNMVMEGLGLSHVAKTFVGDADVRGVSGGQRRRVTIGEMMQKRTPVLCADEISTGLDAQSTHDIILSLMHLTRVGEMTRIISLLQPSPETFSLFDEVILMAEGHMLYAGPVESVEAYFAMLGYQAPDQMDVADFLQVLSTPDGEALFTPPSDESRTEPYTMAELAEEFRKSEEFKAIKEEMEEPWAESWQETQSGSFAKKTHSEVALKKRFANKPTKSIGLNLKRFITMWLRDKRFLIVNAVKNVIMGVSVGGVFFQTDDAISIYGVLFQLNLFIMLGAMTSAPNAVSDRAIFYKHNDANFYGSLSYAMGKFIAATPQAFIDVMIFGTIVYWMVGLDPTAASYFTYIAILFTFSVVMNEQLAVFAAFSPTKTDVQAFSAVILFWLIVFCGFLVYPSVIPGYWSWIYWWNPLAWTYRALLVNEFTSPKWDYPSPLPEVTYGQWILASTGQINERGDIFDRHWIGYTFAYMVPYIFVMVLLSGAFLAKVRTERKGAILGSPDDVVVVAPGDEEEGEKGAEAFQDEDEEIEMPFTPVTLSFTDVCYDVTASTSKETLRLLHDVTGIFEAGRMCALMGSSGAGKTTLMDVIALRKTSGTIAGDIRLNGFEQDQKTFRRCAGYVEQFNVEAPQLTVRETVLFSAKLRLNFADHGGAEISDEEKKELDAADQEKKEQIVDHVLKVLELTPLADAIVGTEDDGLSFEQMKRLSIAVELAASPSIIFLDEPTSGLDSRAAQLVVKVLRTIADQGRTVIATIHQPSSTVFEMFDDLCLLKKGGNLVYFGELGEGSINLIDYFEGLGAARINQGENPANWMLTAITADGSEEFADEFRSSPKFEALKAKIQETIDKRDPSMEVKFESEFAAPKGVRRSMLSDRLVTIYWRSPAYNWSRMLISLVIAFVLGTIFVNRRKPEFYTEAEVSGLLGTIFISFIIIGVLSIVSVLPVMLGIRDSFYKQRAAGMCDHKQLGAGLGVAEYRFILASSGLFCIIFLSMIGTGVRPLHQFMFWGFFCFNTALYSYFGQAFMCATRSMSTAMIFASVFIGINNFFSGYIVRPQYMKNFFQVTYWITPGHYVFEGLVLSQFAFNDTPVKALYGSDLWNALCPDQGPDTECIGTASQYAQVFFGNKFTWDHLWYDIVALVLFLLAARWSTFWALKKFNYTST